MFKFFKKQLPWQVNSLKTRLILSALLMIIIVIPIIGFTLNNAFEVQVRSAVKNELSAYVYSILAVAEVENQQLFMPDQLLENQFNVIESGLYAVIAVNGIGLNKQSVGGFCEAQFSAAKAIQYRYRADLFSQATSKTPRDLQTVIRPALIKLGKQINTELALYLNEGGKLTLQDWEAFKVALDSRYLSDADKQVLFKALSQITLK